MKMLAIIATSLVMGWSIHKKATGIKAMVEEQSAPEGQLEVDIEAMEKQSFDNGWKAAQLVLRDEKANIENVRTEAYREGYKDGTEATNKVLTEEKEKIAERHAEKLEEASAKGLAEREIAHSNGFMEGVKDGYDKGYQAACKDLNAPEKSEKPKPRTSTQKQPKTGSDELKTE